MIFVTFRGHLGARVSEVLQPLSLNVTTYNFPEEGSRLNVVVHRTIPNHAENEANVERTNTGQLTASKPRDYRSYCESVSSKLKLFENIMPREERPIALTQQVCNHRVR